MSTGLFSISRSALLTHQRALATIGQNIANAETPGYSRQEAVLVANDPVRMSFGMVGTGVHVQNVIRKRDILLDEGFRQASGQAGESELRHATLSNIEQIFGEPTDAGLTNALDQYWNSWSDLASSPSSQAARAVVQQRGQQVAGLLNTYDSGLNQQREFNLDRLRSVVGDINQMAAQIADLNSRISQTETIGGQSGDLADQRDLLLDKLSTMAGTRVVPQSNHTIVVQIGNSTLVEGNTARPLSLDLEIPNPPPATPTPDIPVKIRLGNSPDPLTPFGGQLKAMVDVVNKDIPEIRKRLDAVASSLVSSVNTKHAQGFVFGATLPGTAAGNFFDPGTVANPVTAATIKLSADVKADINKIAASGDANAPLDNAVANAMVKLRNDPTSVTYNNGSTTETGSFLTFFRSTATRLGLEVNNASDDHEVASLLVDQTDTRRQSVSGVNTDEELIHMMRVQQAYTAATKLIKSADEMLQTLLSMV
ncbi:MAG: flagellar hook-associated protein FlgK [Gemmatimonas sp.]